MTTRSLALAAAVLLHAASLAAQPAPAAPSPSQLTFYYDYTVKPGKEQEFLDLVKTLAGPVRDRLMAEGVISEWGVEQPLLRGPEVPTYSVWYVTSSLAGVGKVQAAMAEMLGQSSAGAAAARGSRVSTNADRARELLETTRTRDWLIRDLENGYGTKMPAAGAQPYIRYNAIKVRPGKGREFRLAWDKYTKPVYEKLVADGVVEAWGLAVEEIRTDGNFTHLVWVVTSDLAGMDAVRAAFIADRDKRSEDERDTIAATMNALTDADASRSQVSRLVVLRMAGQK